MNEYWQEQSESTEDLQVSDRIVDVLFTLKGKTISVDHAFDLNQSICRHLPWFADDEACALHLIHVVESGNGWIRPDSQSEGLHLSRRSRLTLRLPSTRLKDAENLTGKELILGENEVEVGQMTVKLLSKSAVIFSRYLDVGENIKEDVFLHNVRSELQGKNINVRKMLCGRLQKHRLRESELVTRSLMLADLEIKDSILLQQTGLGKNRKLGCGVFIAHKGIDAVGGAQSRQ